MSKRRSCVMVIVVEICIGLVWWKEMWVLFGKEMVKGH